LTPKEFSHGSLECIIQCPRFSDVLFRGCHTIHFDTHTSMGLVVDSAMEVVVHMFAGVVVETPK
jgi:hypothetical protein